MIPILILNTFQNMAIQFTHDFLLLLGGNGLQSLLDHTAPVHLQGQHQHVPSNLLRQGGLLFRGAELEELLDYIISEHVRHQIVRGGQNLIEDQLFLRGTRPFQFLLDEPRTVLILGELDDVIGQVAKL